MKGHRYGNAGPHRLGTGPIAFDIVDGRHRHHRGKREERHKLVSMGMCISLSLGVENKSSGLADAERYSQLISRDQILRRKRRRGKIILPS